MFWDTLYINARSFFLLPLKKITEFKLLLLLFNFHFVLGLWDFLIEIYNILDDILTGGKC